MDMEIIDTVPASTLDAGDTVMFDGEDFNRGTLQEVLSFEDDGMFIYLMLEDDGEQHVHPDLLVNIYGYTTQEV